MKKLTVFRLFVVLAVVLVVVGTAVFVYADIDKGKEVEIYQISVDRHGNMRLLKGKNDEPKKGETVIELPSSQLVTILEDRIRTLENTLSGQGANITELSNIISALESRVSSLEAQGGDSGNTTYTVPEGCVLWLAMDECQGIDVVDKSKFRNDGVITGAEWVPQNGSCALSFDGYLDYVTITDSASLSVLSALTIEIWVKTTSTTPYMTFASKYYHPDKREWVLQETYENGIKFIIWDHNAGGHRGGYSVSNISDGIWHHIVATWNGNTNNPNTGITIYVDGEAQSYIDQSDGTFVAINDTTRDVLIGGQGNLPARDFNGHISLFRIYDYALSLDEIVNHYQEEGHLFGK